MASFYPTQENDIFVSEYDIIINANDFNVMTINTLIESGAISIPRFQRNFVWDRKRASKFIESLILGLPIPQVFLYHEEKNKFTVIDGQQRLMSIYFFMKGRFPKSGIRADLRNTINTYGVIPDNILSDNSLFQDFKLQFYRFENGKQHPLNNKQYNTLSEKQKENLCYMPIRCMTIRQINTDDDSSIYEIYNRLNTGGLDLSAQEIRACLYHSEFYDMIYSLNAEPRWRKIVGRVKEDDKCRDVEVLLRAYAMLYNGDKYSGSMITFLNRFSKEAQKFDHDKIETSKNIFYNFLDICDGVDKKYFMTKNKAFNVPLFDAVFVAIAKRILDNGIESASVGLDSLNQLKNDSNFKDATTHSVSQIDKIKTRAALADKYLYNNGI